MPRQPPASMKETSGQPAAPCRPGGSCQQTNAYLRAAASLEITPCGCAASPACRLYVSKLLDFQDKPASWSACEFAVRPAAKLKLTNAASVDAAMASLGPLAFALGTTYSLFSGTTDGGLIYGAVVFTNLTTPAHLAAAKGVCARVAAALNTKLPPAYFARPSIGKTAIRTGIYDPLDPDGLCELPACSCLAALVDEADGFAWPPTPTQHLPTVRCIHCQLEALGTACISMFLQMTEPATLHASSPKANQQVSGAGAQAPAAAEAGNVHCKVPVLASLPKRLIAWCVCHCSAECGKCWPKRPPPSAGSSLCWLTGGC